MLRHYLIAALRNMVANKLQSAIAIFGLAIGLAVAILAGITVRNQMNFDDFIPGHERLYLAVLYTHKPGAVSGLTTPHELAAMLKDRLPQVAAVTRLNSSPAVFGQGPAMAEESFFGPIPTSLP